MSSTRHRPAAAVLAVWFFLPLLPLLVWMLAERWSFPSVLPSEWGLAGIGQALRSGFTPAVESSFAIATLTAVCATILGALAARALVFGQLPGKRWISVALFAPVFVPPFVVVMGLAPIFLRMRVPPLLAVSLVLVVAAIPYTTFIMRAVYAAYDAHYEDEARLLGAGPWQVMAWVQIPLIAPGLVAAGFMAFVVGWSDYIVTLILGGADLITLPILIGATASGSGSSSAVAALSIAAILPPLLLLVLTRLAQRRRATTGHNRPQPVKSTGSERRLGYE